MTNYDRLTKSGLSVMSASGLKGAIANMAHALTILQLATKGYVYLSTNQIELTTKGRSLIISGDDTVDPTARHVLQTVFGLPRSYGKTTISFNRGRPSSGFAHIKLSNISQKTSSDWLMQNQYHQRRTRWDWVKRIGVPICAIVFMVCVALFAVDDQSAKGWLLIASLCMIAPTFKLAMPIYKVGPAGQDVLNAIAALRKDSTGCCFDEELLPWIWLAKGKKIQADMQLLPRPSFWNGLEDTWQQDLYNLLNTIERAYPMPPGANYGSSGASGAGGGC